MLVWSLPSGCTVYLERFPISSERYSVLLLQTKFLKKKNKAASLRKAYSLMSGRKWAQLLALVAMLLQDWCGSETIRVHPASGWGTAICGTSLQVWIQICNMSSSTFRDSQHCCLNLSFLSGRFSGYTSWSRERMERPLWGKIFEMRGCTGLRDGLFLMAR